MKNAFLNNQLLIARGCWMVMLLGCDIIGQPSQMSNDISALQKIVHINSRQTSVRWEIFTSPEQTGLQVGPTDSTIMMAELDSWDAAAFSLLPAGETSFYVPEAARPWLSEEFRLLFRKEAGRSIDLSLNLSCRPFASKLKQSGRTAPGFICKSGNKALIYLILESDSAQ